jgi:hypothetical protein
MGGGNHGQGGFAPVRSGDGVSADLFNELQRRIVDSIVAGPGIEVRRTGDRIVITRTDDAIVRKSSGQRWVPWSGDSS